VAEVAALLPRLVQLEFDGRFMAMLSHEPKNYALLEYDGALILRGVAFRSSRAEPFGERFLRQSIERLLNGDVRGVQSIYFATMDAIRRRRLPTYDLSSLVRLTKSPSEYLAIRDTRHELPYEAMLAAGRKSWRIGDRIRVYRTKSGAGLIDEFEEAVADGQDRRDYDVDHYVRLLRETYAIRLSRAFTPADFETLFADPEQMSLFAESVDTIQPILTEVPSTATDVSDCES
jgi:DNA polymerase elongation subunit (family B)